MKESLSTVGFCLLMIIRHPMTLLMVGAVAFLMGLMVSFAEGYQPRVFDSAMTEGLVLSVAGVSILISLVIIGVSRSKS